DAEPLGNALVERRDAAERIGPTRTPFTRRRPDAERSERLALELRDRELTGVEPVPHDRLLDRGDAVALLEAQPEVVILRLVEPVAAQRTKGLGAHRDRPVNEIVPLGQLRGGRRPLAVELAARLVDEHDPTSEQRHLWMRVEESELPLEAAGQG